MRIYINRDSIDIKVKKLLVFGRLTGLMFRSAKIGNLLFEFKKKNKWAIHSYFVFFDFLAIWIDDDKNVVEAKIIKPFTFSVKPKKEFKYLIEVPITTENKHIIEFFRRKRKI